MARILVACEASGRVRDALIRWGHDAVSCDVRPAPGPHIEGDVMDLLKPGVVEQWDAMVAFPPCTHLSGAGARWWPEKRADGRQQAALQFVLDLANAPVDHIAIENPWGHLNTAWRRPDQTVHPWMFGDPWAKRTAWWLKGFPLLQPTDVVPENQRQPGSWVLAFAPSDDRGHLRSVTPQGLADAIGAQWGTHLAEVVQ